MAKNLKMRNAIGATFAVMALAAAITAHASVGLFSTGVDNSGNTLALGATDAHYTVSGGAATFAVNQAQGYAGYWLAPNSTSEWITPLLGAGNTASASAAGGNYVYQTTFDLTGINLATTLIKGNVTADNGITDILINGHSTGFAMGGPNSGAYGSFNSFSINNGFQSGLNTLTFDVVNGSGPTGLRVNFNGTGSILTPVPEPETWAMMVAGFGMMGLMVRRRRTVTGKDFVPS
jgi:hypothetical protein